MQVLWWATGGPNSTTLCLVLLGAWVDFLRFLLPSRPSSKRFASIPDGWCFWLGRGLFDAWRPDRDGREPFDMDEVLRSRRLAFRFASGSFQHRDCARKIAAKRPRAGGTFRGRSLAWAR